MGVTRREATLGALAATGLGAAAAPQATARPWGRLPDGRAVELYTLTNRNGLSAQISNLGGLLVSLKAPDRRGRMADVVLGYDSLEGYLKDDGMIGAAIVGRFANRIGQGRFELDGKTYSLARNMANTHSIHGGVTGWHEAIWRAQPGPGAALELQHVSPDGDEGFPGEVRITVRFDLTDDNRLVETATATTSAPTVINLTNHSYFNLSGDPAHKVLDTELQIAASAFTPGDALDLPTGEIRSVEATPYDFRRMRPIGEGIPATGYNANLIVDPPGGRQLRRAALARDPGSGRTLELWTDQPGVHFYSAHWLKATGRGGAVYGPASAFCLEAQHYPDSPNRPNFPSTVLRPGETFRWRTEFRLGVA